MYLVRQHWSVVLVICVFNQLLRDSSLFTLISLKTYVDTKSNTSGHLLLGRWTRCAFPYSPHSLQPKRLESYIQNKHKKILNSGEKKADWPGALRSKEWHSEVSSPVFFLLHLPQMCRWHQRRLS